MNLSTLTGMVDANPGLVIPLEYGYKRLNIHMEAFTLRAILPLKDPRRGSSEADVFRHYRGRKKVFNG